MSEKDLAEVWENISARLAGSNRAKQCQVLEKEGMVLR